MTLLTYNPGKVEWIYMYLIHINVCIQMYVTPHKNDTQCTWSDSLITKSCANKKSARIISMSVFNTHIMIL